MRRSATALLMSLAATSAIAGCTGGAESIDFGDTGTTSTTTGNGGHGGSGAQGGGDTGGATTGGAGGTTGQGGSGATAGQGGVAGSGAQGGTGGIPEGCGDGVATGAEACDGADLNGSSCFDFGYSKFAGLACAPDCTLDASGCEATCDGALVEPGETCDGTHVGDADCTDFGFVSPAGLKCNVTCNGLDPSGCAAECNGKLEPGEDCDGADLGGKDCTDFGFASPGNLACVACAIDTSGCMAKCGNGALEAGEDCDDGNLQNGDGCSSTCTLEGQTCNDAIAVALGLGTQTLTGTTAGGGAHTGSCASAAPDRVYAVTVSATGFLTASLTRANTKYPSVLYARTTCDAASPDILCADSKDPANATQLDGGEVISFPVNMGQLVYVFVDGATANDAGNYELVLDLSAGTNCNDPIPVRVEPGTPMRLLGLTTGKSSSGAGSCGGGGIGFGAEDVVYDLRLPGGAQSTIAIDAAGTSYNSLLYLRNDCNNGFAEIACNNSGGNGGESLNVTPGANASTWTWIDGSNGANGNYTLIVTPPP